MTHIYLSTYDIATIRITYITSFSQKYSFLKNIQGISINNILKGVYHENNMIIGCQVKTKFIAIFVAT